MHLFFRMSNLLGIVFGTVVTVLTAVVVQAEEPSTQVKAQALLTRMAEATRKLDYRGHFTYEYGGAQETLSVTHTVKKGIEYDRLEHLTGPAREILRNGRRLDCRYVGDQLLGGRLQTLGSEQAGLSRFYHFHVRGRERVAGRIAIVVDIVPRDPFRYGYSLSMDEQSGLLLKSLLIGRKKQILERFQFIDLQVGPVPQVADAAVQAASSSRRVIDHLLSPCNLPAQTQSQRWHLSWLPMGFVFTGEERKYEKEGSSWRDVLMYTDGLTSFSVFIESVSAHSSLEGQARRGATVVYLQHLKSGENHYRVTVVGEVPLQTAQRVAAALVSKPQALIAPKPQELIVPKPQELIVPKPQASN